MKKDSIAIIGFMATGKTTVGMKLTEYLGNNYKFIETDQIIIEMAGKPIPRIFSEDGEEKFREYEAEACKKVSKLKKVVISCGGGVVLNKNNIENLKKNCYVILLTTTSDEIYNRIMKNGKTLRPVINKEDPKKEIENILKFRQPLYNRAADITINTTGKKIDEIVREMLAKVE